MLPAHNIQLTEPSRFRQRQERGSQSLKLRGLIVFNSDTVWLIGDDWGERQPVQQSNPFAFRMPWKVSQ